MAAIVFGSAEAREVLLRDFVRRQGYNPDGTRATGPKEVAGKPGRYLPAWWDGDVMPSLSQFNDAKPANWADAGAQMQRLGLAWTDLAEQAGLKPRKRGSQTQTA